MTDYTLTIFGRPDRFELRDSNGTVIPDVSVYRIVGISENRTPTMFDRDDDSENVTNMIEFVHGRAQLSVGTVTIIEKETCKMIRPAMPEPSSVIRRMLEAATDHASDGTVEGTYIALVLRMHVDELMKSARVPPKK